MDDKTKRFLFQVGELSKFVKKGEANKFKCECGGNLIIAKASNNGHIRAACDKCKLRIIQ